jgi:signal transduction histidine kinase
MLRTIGYPAGRPAARWVSDVLLTVIAAATPVPGLVHDNVRPLGAAGVLVLALTAAPLLARRIWPVPVFGWLLVATIGAGIWNASTIEGPALLIALYTVASLRPRRDALICAAALELVMITGLLRYAGERWLSNAVFLSGMIAAALGLGLYVAARRAYLAANRAYLAELHDRAERLERERDQQAALAAAAERARIAREMHDIVAHHLTVMTTLAEAAVATSAASPERATEAMRSVADIGRRALADTRKLLGLLRQGSGDMSGDGLAPVPGLGQLDTLIEQVRTAGLDTTLEVRGQVPDVPAGVQLAVYRLVQEALTNTLKHGGAGARASARLQFLPGELRVDVDDDGGVGGDPRAGGGDASSDGAGGGLPGMRERIRAYGGHVHAGPRQQSGWTVSARLPLDDGGPA